MLQALLNGLIQGLLFACVGIAFSLVYATTRVFHVALAASYALAPFVVLAALEIHAPWLIAVTAAALAAAVLGLANEELIHWPLERRHATPEVHLVGSLGAFLVVGQIVVLLWGNDARFLRSAVDSVYSVAGLRITSGQAIGAGVAASLLVGVFTALRWSDLGLQLRAMANNPSLLSSLGRDVRLVRRTVFGLAGALAAIIAIAAARDVGFDPNAGLKTVLVGIAATIVGGRGSFGGAAVAGVALGILRAQVAWHAAARWEDAATFAVLAIFLLFVPGGLRGIGRRMRLEDEA